MRCAICEESVDVLDLCPMCELRTGTPGRAIIGRPPRPVVDAPRLCARKHQMSYMLDGMRWRCRECTRQLDQAKRDKKKRGGFAA